MTVSGGMHWRDYMETRGTGDEVILRCHPDDLAARWPQQRKAMYERRGKTVILRATGRGRRAQQPG